MSTKAKIFETLLAGLEFGGVVANSYVVYFVTAGTGPSIASLKTIWLDANKTTPAANPYTLNSDGRATLYLDGNYDVVIKDAIGGNVKATWNVYISNDIIEGLNIDSRDASGGMVNVSIVAANDPTATVRYIGKSSTDETANAVNITPASGTIGKLTSWSITNSGEYALLIPIAADNNYVVE